MSDPHPKDSETLSCLLTLSNRRGLHARASAKLAKMAAGLSPTLKVAKNGEAVKATSIMGLMMLGAAFGECVTVSASGDGAEAAIEAVKALFEDRFGELE